MSKIKHTRHFYHIYFYC